MLTEKHGFPPGSDNKAIGFAVLGFGKLGGIELGYGSDLDMVFLYDCEDGNALTDGPKPIPSMNERIYNWLQDLITVYSGQSTVNLQLASLEVLQVMPDMTLLTRGSTPDTSNAPLVSSETT